mgnify:CR=1 FL=1
MNKELNIIIVLILVTFIVTFFYLFLASFPKNSDILPTVAGVSEQDESAEASKHKILSQWWPLKVGARKRFTIQAKNLGQGVVEQVVVEKRKIGNLQAYRLRATHRYDSGQMGIEELYVSPSAGKVEIPARMTSGGDFGFYKPPMVFLSLPMAVGTQWSGKTELSETKKDGTPRPAIDIPWQGEIVAFEPVSVPAGRFTSCARVENRVDGRFLTREWFAKDVGVVRREVLVGPDVMVLQELVLSY